MTPGAAKALGSGELFESEHDLIEAPPCFQQGKLTRFFRLDQERTHPGEGQFVRVSPDSRLLPTSHELYLSDRLSV